MEVFAIGLLVLISVVGFVTIRTKNQVVRKRNALEETLASVDTHLQKRHDLIPNLISVARRFMEHEKELLEQITALRASAERRYDRTDPEAVATHLEAEEALRQGMQRFVGTVENYPDLRSEQTMAQLMEALEDVEADVAAARRFYNQAVSALRDATETFPGSVFARGMNIHRYPYFEAEEIARKPVDVSAALG